MFFPFFSKTDSHSEKTKYWFIENIAAGWLLETISTDEIVNDQSLTDLADLIEQVFARNPCLKEFFLVDREEIDLLLAKEKESIENFVRAIPRTLSLLEMANLLKFDKDYFQRTCKGDKVFLDFTKVLASILQL